MSDHVSQARDPVEMLAEEFLERKRRGELPSLKEYIDRFPDLADEIRDVFPALVMMDEIDPQSADLAASLGGINGLCDVTGRKQLGDFRILRVIGHGGMGIVYEAYQESLSRHVALKVLPTAISARAVFRERFQREARAAARLHHTNIVPIFGVGEDHGVLYFAMQFIQGQSLDAVLEDVRRLRGLSPTEMLDRLATITLPISNLAKSLVSGQFTTVEMFFGNPQPTPPGGFVKPQVSTTQSDLCNQPEHRYFRSIAWQGVQAAEGLAHAHTQGILHRDIKPSNLLLDAKGTLWIADFGLAKSEGTIDITQSGEFVGTLRYMAPERLEGKGDARSDIYALGVTLYEMLTLAPPFTGSDRVGLVGQITGATPLPPSRLAPLLPRDLETIVLKAMHRDPDARYSTAGELAADLRCFLENRPIRARRTSPLERVGRWCWRNPAVASLIGAVFLLLVCLTIGSMAAAFRLSAERNAVIAAEADGAEKLYESLVAQAHASRYSHRIGQRFETLEAIRKAAHLVHERHMPAERLHGLRNLAISALALPDFRTSQSCAGFQSREEDWEADDRFNFYVRWRGTGGAISLRHIETSEEIATLEGTWTGAAFSPGSQFLLCHGNNRFRVWELSGGKPDLIQEGDEAGSAFHPDGKHLAVGRRDGRVWVYDLTAPATKPTLLTTIQPGDGQLTIDPTGARLAIIRAGKVLIVDAKTGNHLATIPEPKPIQNLAWHPSANYLALVPDQTNPDIQIWDMKKIKIKKIATLKGTRGDGVRVAFTPDGDQLVSGGWQGILRLWDWRTERLLLQHPARSNLRFDAHGRLLIMDAEEMRFRLIELGGGREHRSIVQQSAEGKNIFYWVPVIHPGGRVLVVPMFDYVRMFDLETGDELADLPPSRYNVAIQKDGAILTNGDRGLLRWPIQERKPVRWEVGPPELLHSGSFLNLSSDNNGATIAQATGAGAIIVRPSMKTFLLGPHSGAKHTSVSPDGKYVATGINDGDESIKIWNTASQSLAASFPMGRFSSGKFDATGQWLVLHGGVGWRVVHAGTWDQVLEGRDWNTKLSFTSDGAIVAIGSTQGDIKLIEMASGKELAKLEDPNQSFGDCIFTPDGARLVVSSDSDKAIYVWDLSLIRAGLTDLGLDWDAPPFPETKQVAPLPFTIKVDRGNLFVEDSVVIGLASFRLAVNPFDFEAYLQRGRAHGRRNEVPRALADYTMALTLMPTSHRYRGELLIRRSSNYRKLKDDFRARSDLQEFADQDLSVTEELQAGASELCNVAAWELVNGSEKQRDLDKALSLARKAVQLNPEGWAGLNTMGLVLYRLGDYDRATKTFEHNLSSRQSELTAFDQFFLAMCYARQGNHSKAQQTFDQAVKNVEEKSNLLNINPDWAGELKTFRLEAEGVLRSQLHQD
jgi:eukaryotic-like serine/threonine-protein kinase